MSTANTAAIVAKKGWFRNLSFKKMLLLITTIALIARLIVIFFSDVNELLYDEVDYHMLSKNLYEKKGFVQHELSFKQYQGGKTGDPTAYRTPVLPAFMAAHYFIFGENLLMPRLTLVLLSALCCIYLGLLGKVAFNERTGLIAALVWAFYPPTLFSWFSANHFNCENISIFLVIVSYYHLFLLFRKFNIKDLLLSSLLFGLAMLTRGYLVLTLPIVCLFLLIYANEKKFKTAFLFGFFASLVLVSWMTRNYVKMGKAVLSTQTDAFFWGNNNWTRGSIYNDIQFVPPWTAPQVQGLVQKYPGIQDFSEIKLSETFMKEGFLYAKTHPVRTVGLLFKKSAGYALPFKLWEGGFIYKYHYVYAILMIGVILAFGYVKNKKEYFLLLLPYFGVWIATLLTITMDRYRYVIEPLIIVVGVYGLLEFYERRRNRMKQKAIHS